MEKIKYRSVDVHRAIKAHFMSQELDVIPV
jgi:hypothetical protein